MTAAQLRRAPPQYVKRAMNAATGTLGSDRAYINCQRAQAYITKRLGLCTDENVQEFAGEVVNFDWHTQRWYICNNPNTRAAVL